MKTIKRQLPEDNQGKRYRAIFAKLYVKTRIVELYISIRSAAKFENFYMYTTAINNFGKASLQGFHTKYNLTNQETKINFSFGETVVWCQFLHLS